VATAGSGPAAGPGREHLGLLRAGDDLGPARAAVGEWFGSTARRGYKMFTLAEVPPPVAGATALAPADLHPSSAPDALVRGALREGFAGVGILIRAAGVVAAASDDFHDQVETALTRLSAEHPVATLCVYDRPGVGVEHLDLAVAHHRDGLHEQQLTLRRTGDTVHLVGEVDARNLDVLDAAVRAVAAGPPRRLRLDLSGTGFLSAGAASVLHRHVTGLREDGVRVDLAGVRPHTERVLRLIGTFRGQPG
jgi:anti-anti-sigma factor